MAEPHLDHPGDISWFKGHGPARVLGSCPHQNCGHWGQSVIAHGPSFERYELVNCGSLDRGDESPSDCAGTCRAWVNSRGHVVTEWLHVDLGDPGPPRRNPHCSNCGDTRGGPIGHETSECRMIRP